MHGRKDETFILLVEDNEDDADLTIAALRENKIDNEVVVVRDGVEALEYLFAEGEYAGRDAREQPGLVLLDIKLPRLDGLEVLTRMRADERTCLVPVVVLTTSREERDLVASYSRGANSYIRKPVDFAEFTLAIKQLSAYWLVLNERPRGSLRASL